MELEKRIEKLQTELNALKTELKVSRQKYPVYCKNRFSNLVVKFTEECVGEVVVNDENCIVGHVSDAWQECTNSQYWQQLEVCPKTGFFDGQAVWCWDDDYTHGRVLMFYHVKNKGVYNFSGEKANSYDYDNYEPFEGNYHEWMLKAFETLER